MSLRVLFCGTPEFAVPSLRMVRESPHRLTGVVTVPDRPGGRGRRLRASAVKTFAQSLEVPIHQPEALDRPDFLDAVRDGAPDVILVVAFRILPEAFYGLPARGAINVHASILPAYRGAAPIARALMDGCTETGVTTFQIVRRVDRGGILLQRRLPIRPEDNAGTLSDRLATAGARLARETLDGLEAGTLSPTEQDESRSSRAPKLTPNDRPIRWEEPAEVSHHRVRGLAPVPGATVRAEGKLIKLLETDFEPAAAQAAPGTVTDPGHRRGIAVATGAGTLFLRRVQPEGRNPMAVTDWLRGHTLIPGTRFDSD